MHHQNELKFGCRLAKPFKVAKNIFNLTLKKIRSGIEKYLVEQSQRTLKIKFTTDIDKIIAACSFRVLGNNYVEIMLLAILPKKLKKGAD